MDRALLKNCNFFRDNRVHSEIGKNYIDHNGVLQMSMGKVAKCQRVFSFLSHLQKDAYKSNGHQCFSLG